MNRNILAAQFGDIPGIRVGKWWPNRKECCADSVHPMPFHGIYGRRDDGARSVVLSGNSVFENEDHGETFTYIGSGGRAPGQRFGPQTEHQTWDNTSNASLKRSCIMRGPVRVVRGKGGSRFAPYDGYRYDGLYIVSNPRIEPSETTGFLVCKFDFTRQQNQDPLPTYRGPSDKAGQEERRRQYWRDRRAEEDGHESASPAPTEDLSDSEESLSPTNDDARSENEDELEALFNSHEAAEEALIPVHSVLAKFSRSGESKAEKARRRKMLLQIGRHITAVVREKSQEGGDASWWNKELWTFVLKSVPRKGHNYKPEQLENHYKRLEKRGKPRPSKYNTTQGTATNPIEID